MRILLFGKNGQVGWELQRSLAPLGEVLALDRHSTAQCGDLLNTDGLRATILRWRPDAIVNAAAYTAVDQAESESDSARRINTLAPAAMADAAAAIGAWLVHYSTDYVYDGSGSHFRKEDEATAPLSVYGSSKRDGELAIAARAAKYLIFRTSWVYAARGGNFAKTMLRLAQERTHLKVIDDQIGAPTSAELIADITALALQQILLRADDTGAGIYHLSADGETSWYDYARHVIETARRLHPERNWTVQDIAAIPSRAYPMAARRPLNSRLDTHKLRDRFQLRLPPWQQGVDRLLQEIL